MDENIGSHGNSALWKKISILSGLIGATLAGLTVAMVGFYENQESIRIEQLKLIQSAIVFNDKQQTASNLKLLLDLGLLKTPDLGLLKTRHNSEWQELKKFVINQDHSDAGTKEGGQVFDL